LITMLSLDGETEPTCDTPFMGWWGSYLWRNLLND